MARVFVTQFFTRGDFSQAEEWGEVVFMTDREHKPEPTHKNVNSEVYAELNRAMADYIQGVDYLLVAPSQVVNLMVGSLMKSGIHNVLKWDNRSMTYRLHRVKL